MKYIAMDIGCIECGEDSRLLGVFATEAEAEAACKVAREKQAANWYGQHSMEVFVWQEAA